jgi:hypothetical protein
MAVGGVGIEGGGIIWRIGDDDDDGKGLMEW